jgi:hypothetical protein
MRVKYTPSSIAMDISYTVDDIEQEVVRWYFKKKLKIPAIEKEFLEAYRKQEEEQKASAYMWTGPDCSYTPSLTSTITIQTEKPAYGTPAFWKDWWAKKKAKEAAAASAAGADGLSESLSTMTISTKPKKTKASKSNS